MPKQTCKLTTSQQTEAVCIKLFDQIDHGLHKYIASAASDCLKEEAWKNTIAMLDILKTIFQSDYRIHSAQVSRGMTGDSRRSGVLA